VPTRSEERRPAVSMRNQLKTTLMRPRTETPTERLNDVDALRPPSSKN